jgi:hypothetical protein
MLNLNIFGKPDCNVKNASYVISKFPFIIESDLLVVNKYPCGVFDKITGELRPMRILITSTDKYLPIFLNWLIFYHNICSSISFIYIVCLDSVIESHLSNFGFRCSYVHHLPIVQMSNRLWLLRALVTKQLLIQGFDVLMTDTDAIWLRNPFDMLSSFPESDVIASRASFPENISKRLGATVCMGFLYIKSNPRTIVLWEEFFIFMSKMPRADDQRNFNQLLLNFHIKYDVRPSFVDSVDANSGLFHLKQGTPMVLTLLPHKQVIRICDPQKIQVIMQSIVAHCMALSKNRNTKSFSERVFRIWALRDKWDRDYEGGMKSFFLKIMSKNVSNGL